LIEELRDRRQEFLGVGEEQKMIAAGEDRQP
jgi:hypothetical protein